MRIIDIIIIILLIMWLGGFSAHLGGWSMHLGSFSIPDAGGLLHILIVIAVILLIIRLLGVH